jgi:hypothetical protein
VTFEEKGGKTLVVVHELYPSKEALDGAIAGMEGGMPETFAQLDELLVTLGASGGDGHEVDDLAIAHGTTLTGRLRRAQSLNHATGPTDCAERIRSD